MSGSARIASPLCLSIALGSLLLAAPAAQAAQDGLSWMTAPFERLEDTGPRGTVRVRIEDGAFEALAAEHDTGQLLHLLSFPLPGNESVDLLLRPVRVMEEGGTAIVVRPDGREERLAPQVRAFSGSIPGRASRVFVAISPTLLDGYVELDGENYFVSNGGSRRDQPEATISHGSLFGSPSLAEWCGAVASGEEEEEVGGVQQLGTTVIRRGKVFLECDDAYRALFATDQDAIDYCALLVTAASEIYRRDLGVLLEIPSGYLRLWTTTPPWGVTTTFGDLGKFSNYWASAQNPNRGLKRAAVHLLTTPVFGGIAQGIGVVCSKANGYAISSVFGSFPYPIQHTNPNNWDLFVLSHEFGHVFGSIHSFDFSPPIACDDGSGPDFGTIMSYCHLTYGVGGVGMRFHLREQDMIRSLVRNKGCLQPEPEMLGDYDMNAVLDAADLAELDACLAQGFGSRGCQDAFDFDADGMVTTRDRDVLVAIMAGVPPASATIRNGSGANCGLCYAAANAPVIGQTWTAYVANNLGPPTLTTIYGASAPLVPGLPTAHGELLIALSGLGGQTLFHHNEFTVVGLATHTISIPYDLSLLGAEVYTQAVTFEAPSFLLLNGIDLVFSNYE